MHACSLVNLLNGALFGAVKAHIVFLPHVVEIVFYLQQIAAFQFFNGMVDGSFRQQCFFYEVLLSDLPFFLEYL